MLCSFIIIVKAIARKQQKSIVCQVLITCASFKNSWLAADSHELLAHAINSRQTIDFGCFRAMTFTIIIKLSPPTFAPLPLSNNSSMQFLFSKRLPVTPIKRL
jgi:hypothetical protein